MNITFLFIFAILGSLLLYFCRKNNLIIDFKLEKHKRFSSKSKSNSIGGILLGIFFIYHFIYISEEIYLLIFLLFMLLIGLMSDIKKLNNAGSRFFLQLILVIFFVTLLDFQIVSTKIEFVDRLLTNNFFNIFFVTFCLMVLINGGNFVDGLNGLLTKYYLLIYVLIYFMFPENESINKDFLINLIFVLIFILILNLFGLIYLGDSGAYLLSLFTGLYLINFAFNNAEISPYIIIIFLWYPCFELLFSIIRRSNKKMKAYKPDALHLHQYIYFFIKKKFNILNNLFAHLMTSLVINSYNLIIFIVSLNFIYNSNFLVYILILNIFFYLLIYRFLKKS